MASAPHPFRNRYHRRDCYLIHNYTETESVLDHLTEEESTLFPKAQEILGPELDRLGAEMEKLKDKLEGEESVEIIKE